MAGWNYSEILVLAASYFSIEAIVLVAFHRNLIYWFPQRLRDGTFDGLLTKPISPLFYTSFKIIDAFDLTASSVSVALLWWYIFSKQIIVPSLFEIGLFMFLSAIAVIFVFSLLLIVASTAFWTITTTGAGRLFESVFRAARFPGDIFKGPARIALLYILPVGLIVSVPADIFAKIRLAAYYLSHYFYGYFDFYSIQILAFRLAPLLQRQFLIFMRKYWAVFKANWQVMLTYRANIVLWFLTAIFQMVFYCIFGLRFMAPEEK